MNITLIGMPGVGKSTIGKELAKKLDYKFIDTDKLIEKEFGLKLYKLIQNVGEDKFLEIEEKTNLELGKFNNCVISPGGSTVYSSKAMEFLKKSSIVIFLDSRIEIITKRLINQETRGIIGLKKGLKNLFKERQRLYKRYADIIIETADNPKKVVRDIIKITQKYSTKNLKDKFKN